jgi:hypothetical protein
VPDRDQVAVLSHSLRMRRYATDRSVIGKAIELSQTSYTVVGVLPAGVQALSGRCRHLDSRASK